MRSLGTILVLVCLPGAAAAATVEGTVYFDRDGDGLFSAGDAPIPGARVAWGYGTFAAADGNGEYTLTVPDGAAGIVWVSVPEGGVPGPRWASVAATGVTSVDLGIEPLDGEVAATTLTFVVAADAHLDGVVNTGMIDDLEAAVSQALAHPTPPRFFTVVGDVTQANRPQDFDGVDQVLSGFSIPWVPVPGNHDWYDGGAAYRARWGPDMYSFTTGGVHFIVWNSEISTSTAVSFLMADLAGVDPATTVIALGHKPPRDDTAAVMRAAGIDYVFTGHWHSNRAIDHDGMIELTTQPLIFGGVDLTPAGYRVVTVAGGELEVDLHAFLDEPVLQVVWPRGDQCAASDDEVLVAIEVGAELAGVEIRIDGEPVEATAAGGWLWRARLAAAPGRHTIEVTAGADTRTALDFDVCDAETRPFAVADWLQQQGGPEHGGAVEAELIPSLEHAWIAVIGSHLHQTAPIVAGGRVFVTYGDFVANGGGGVVALDAVTGAELWRATPGRIRNSAAVEDGAVVVATADGVLHAFETSDGTARWSVDLGEGVDETQSSLWAAPTVRDGVVYAGVQRRVAAVAIDDGEVLWTDDPDPEGVWLGSYGALAVTDELVVGTFNRTAGMIAWNRSDGVLRWRVVEPSTKAIHGAPLVAGDRLYVANAGGEVSAFDLATGEEQWSRVVADADDWDYSVSSNLAIADGRLFVATQWGSFVAVAAYDGDVLWSYDARPGPLRTANFRGPQPGFQASPVVTGTVVWIADASGLLVALDTASGTECWRRDLGVPALGGLAVAGELLLIPTWDGAIHALVPTPDATAPEHPGGCCDAGAGGTADAILVLLGALAIRRRGPARRPRRRPCRCAARRRRSQR